MFLQATLQQFSGDKIKAKGLAIIADDGKYSWAELTSAINRFSQKLEQFKCPVLAFYADNSAAWIIVDLACQQAKVTLLPLPAFFSDSQLQHAVQQAGATALLHQPSQRMDDLFASEQGDTDLFADLNLILTPLNIKPVSLPDNTAKITFTSGSTGQPKGVCLSTEHQIRVAKALVKATNLKAGKHLCVIPFSTLLENIAGIYTTLLQGGSLMIVSPEKLGFNGGRGFDVSAFLDTISQVKPSSLIVLPELLLALVNACKQGWQSPRSLEFIAVGGSKVSAKLLQQAHDFGLPVYEGYGLSECASVVALNNKQHHQLGSVGQLLEHVNVRIDNNEIIVRDSAFLGYVSEPATWYQTDIYTGDLGYIDQQNHLHIQGRKKNVLISSFGRNINPEWLESELLATGLFQQCVVFGDAKPYCVALISLRDNTIDDATIQQVIDNVNKTLPDYAHIKNWSRLNEALTTQSGLITSNGRPVREKIKQHYSTMLTSLYKGQS